MLARNSHNLNWGKDLSEVFTDAIRENLLDTFKSDLEASNYDLDILACTYPDELLLSISMLPLDDRVPITCLFSSDILPKTKIDHIINQMLAVFSNVATDVLETKEVEYSKTWEKVEIKKSTFFIKITRENTRLTLEASKLLKE